MITSGRQQNNRIYTKFAPGIVLAKKQAWFMLQCLPISKYSGRKLRFAGNLNTVTFFSLSFMQSACSDVKKGLTGICVSWLKVKIELWGQKPQKFPSDARFISKLKLTSPHTCVRSMEDVPLLNIRIYFSAFAILIAFTGSNIASWKR
jgi:hypothetical protein